MKPLTGKIKNWRNPRVWLQTGRFAYDVPIARLGHVIEVVRVRADSQDEAEDKALDYLKANLYPLRTECVPEET
jgi:hypothetical protein